MPGVWVTAPGLGPQVMVKEGFREKLANNLRNVEEGRMRTMRAVFERTVVSLNLRDKYPTKSFLTQQC